MNRWLIYQKERFPIVKNGLLVAAFSSCAVLYAAMLGNSTAQLNWKQFLTAFIVCLCFFLQLRIADEFKDAEEDARYRPYRPVPRGLVKLRELGWIFFFSALAQLCVAWWLHPKLLWILFPSWAYLAGMSFEFGAREWLKARPITYLWTHMFIMPIVDFFATACHWVSASRLPPAGLAWFLAASFLNGLILEIGRKLRVPATEEDGVPTYSKLWGMRRAAVVWLCAVATTALCATIAAWLIGFAWMALGIMLLQVAACAWLTWKFLRHATPKLATLFETASGLGTLVLYLTLGLAAFYLRS